VLVDEGLALPEPVLDMRRQLGLDYGKIDYAIHAGQVVILDVNRTPCISDPAVRAQIGRRLGGRHLVAAAEPGKHLRQPDAEKSNKER